MKLAHILFAVDYSSGCSALNSDVEFLAKHFNARVTLLHAFEVPAAWFGSGDVPLMSGGDLITLGREEKARLDAYFLNVPETMVQRVSVEGNAAHEIVAYAQSHAMDLIVMGTRGHNTIRRFVLGSVAARVLHEAQCHVWMRHSRDDSEATRKIELKHVLCSIDVSEQMVPLLQITRDFAASFDATVHVIHCLTGERRNLVEEEIARGEIDQLQEQAGTEFPVLTREGAPAPAIAKVAVEYETDLIIVGRGRSQEALGTLRTHIPELIHEAPCAVLSLGS